MKDIDLVLENRENAKTLLTAFQVMLNNTSDMIFVKDKALHYLAVTKSFVETVGGQSVNDIIGHSDFELFANQELAARYVADDRKLMAEGENLIDFVEPLPDKDGRARYGNTSKYLLRDSRGELIGLLGVTRDITNALIAKQYHQQELEYLFELPEDAYAAIFIDIHGWRIVSERRQLVEGLTIPSYDTIDAVVKGALENVPEGSEAHNFFLNFTPDMLKAIHAKGKRSITLEYPRRMQDSSFRWAKTHLTFLIDPTNSHLCVMMVIQNIDPQKQKEQQILQAAEIDVMTGLLNRAATMDQIRSFLTGPGVNGTHALLIIDVDDFKAINDTYGHLAGDEYLIRFAQAVKNGFRGTDIVGRIGGDEFFVLMKDVSSQVVVEEKANTLLRDLHTIWDTHTSLEPSGSIGISFYHGDDRSLEQLYEQADRALYQAKREGKNRIVFA